MAKLENYYELLEVAPNATSAEIRDSFIAKSKLYHTDVGQGNHYFQALLNEAYETLKNSDKRAEYDKALMEAQKGTAALDRAQVAETKKQIREKLGLPDHYNALNVSRQVTPEEILEAYRRVYKQFQEGVFGPKTEERALSIMKAAQKARQVLSSPEKAHYDEQWDATYGMALKGCSFGMLALPGRGGLVKANNEVKTAVSKAKPHTLAKPKASHLTQEMEIVEKTQQRSVPQVKNTTKINTSSPKGVRTTKPIDLDTPTATHGKSASFKGRQVLPSYINVVLMQEIIKNKPIAGADISYPVRGLFGIFGKDYTFQFAIEKDDVFCNERLESLNGQPLTDWIYYNKFWNDVQKPFMISGREVIALPAETFLPMTSIRNSHFIGGRISKSHLASIQEMVTKAILANPQIIEAYFDYENQQGKRY